MAQEYIAAWGYHTGVLQTPRSIRNGFSFDLTHVDLSDRVVLGASLQLSQSRGDGEVCLVQVSDPSGRTTYGVFRASPALDGVHGALTDDALRDLQEAAGGLFQVHVTAEDAMGEPLRLEDRLERQILVLAVTDAASAATAA